MKNRASDASKFAVSAFVPGYAVDLFVAAKFVAWPPVGATQEMLTEYADRLRVTVIAFEAAMPVIDGEIQEDKNNDSPRK